MSKQETPLKQRLIGAIVLVALGVIFIPMFLGGEGERGVPLFGTNIPDKPAALDELGEGQPQHQLPPPPPPGEVRTLVDDASPPAAVAEIPAASPAPKPQPAPTPPPAAAPKVETPPATTPAPAANPLSWAVQVGSFAERARAIALRDRLRKQGFDAFAEAVTTREGRRFRVRVGPVGKREQAEQLRAAVARKLKLKGFVVRHP